MNNLSRVYSLLVRFLRTVWVNSGVNDIACYYDLCRNASLRDVGKGKTAIMLATGPSIKSQDLSLLEGYDCFSCSNFYMHRDIGVIRPRFHFFAPWHVPVDEKDYIDWLRDADNMLPSDVSIFLGYSDKKKVEGAGVFCDRAVHYIFNMGYASRSSFNLLRPINGPATAALMILPVLLYMGYNEIYLVGCDHNVLRDYGCTLSNFYDLKDEVRACNKTASVWEGGILPALRGEISLHEMYRVYSGIAERNGVAVYNLSPDSWLDVFPYKRFEEIFGSSPKLVEMREEMDSLT